MKLLRTLITASALMLPALASAQDVKIDFDKAYDFSTVKTYAISIGTKWGNDLSERRVLTEIDEEIAAKGWKKVDAAQANAIVVLHGATQTKRSANTFYSGGYGGLWLPRFRRHGLPRKPSSASTPSARSSSTSSTRRTSS